MVLVSVDNDEDFEPDFCVDIIKWAESGRFKADLRSRLGSPPWVDLLAAAPECTQVSLANLIDGSLNSVCRCDFV